MSSARELREQLLSEVFQTLLAQTEQGRTVDWDKVGSDYPELVQDLRELVGAAQLVMFWVEGRQPRFLCWGKCWHLLSIEHCGASPIMKTLWRSVAAVWGSSTGHINAA